MQNIDIQELTQRLAEIQIAKAALSTEELGIITQITDDANRRAETRTLVEQITARAREHGRELVTQRITRAEREYVADRIERAERANRAAAHVPRAVRVFNIGDRVIIRTGAEKGKKGPIVRITPQQYHIEIDGVTIRRAKHNVKHEQ